MLGAIELNGHEVTLALGLGEGIDWLTGRRSQYSDIFGGDTSPWRDRGDYEFPKDAQEPRIHWVICGGESGPKARPMHPAWPRALRDQCAAAGVAFHFKQWGEWCPEGEQDSQTAALAIPSPATRQTISFYEFPNGPDAMGARRQRAYKVGKAAAGRLLDGMEHNGFPA